jgi:hypothetical protein
LTRYAIATQVADGSTASGQAGDEAVVLVQDQEEVGENDDPGKAAHEALLDRLVRLVALCTHQNDGNHAQAIDDTQLERQRIITAKEEAI